MAVNTEGERDREWLCGRVLDLVTVSSNLGFSYWHQSLLNLPSLQGRNKYFIVSSMKDLFENVAS